MTFDLCKAKESATYAVRALERFLAKAIEAKQPFSVEIKADRVHASLLPESEPAIPEPGK